MTSATEFLQAVYGDDGELPGLLMVGTVDPPSFAAFTSVESAAAEAERLSVAGRNSYYGLALQDPQKLEILKAKKPHTRGTAETAAALPGIGIDLDIGDKGSGKQYPPTLDDALALINEMPLQPTLIVNSGGGLHVYWLFKELWVIESDDMRHQAEAHLYGWHQKLKRRAKKHGWDVDSTYDLARIFRPVGTRNFKYESPCDVTTHSYSPERRYLPTDFEEFAEDPPRKSAVHEGNGQLQIPSTPVPDDQLGDVFQALACQPEFLEKWQRRGRQLKSASEYTFKIGIRLLECGASDQETVNAMVTWRHRHGEKIKSVDWYSAELNRIKSRIEEGKKTDDKAGQDATQFFCIPDTNVRLAPQAPRKTEKGKLVVPVIVQVDGQPVDRVEVNSSQYGRSQAEKFISRITGSEHGVAVAVVIGQLLIDAGKRVESASASDAPTVQDLVFEHVPKSFDLQYRTKGGAWSEKRGHEVTRSEFITYTPKWLVDRCQSAVDAPRSENGLIRPTVLVRQIEAALKVLWSSAVEKLPDNESDADLSETTAAGQRFRAAIVRLWTSMTTHEATETKTADNTEISKQVARASLASRAETAFEPYRRGRKKSIPTRQGWEQIQKGFHAYWRPYKDADGNIRLLLAMRHTLADQIHVEVPGADSATSLQKLGRRYGCFADTSPVRDRLTDGSRLCLLSAKFVDEVTAEPERETNEYVEKWFADSSKAENTESVSANEKF